MCPLTSRAMDNDEMALEAAALDVHGAGDLVRLGLHAVTGDWRDTPGVEVDPLPERPASGPRTASPRCSTASRCS